MRLGIVSDIHCNIAGLERALELMAPFDELWCAGDSVFQFRWSNDVVARLRDLEAEVVLGNHEETILGRDGERALSSPKVDQDLVAWMRTKPYRVERQIDGKTVVMTHGSPWEPWKDYHYPQETIWSRAADLEWDALIVGHTHYKRGQRLGGVLVINHGFHRGPGRPREGVPTFVRSVGQDNRGVILA